MSSCCVRHWGQSVTKDRSLAGEASVPQMTTHKCPLENSDKGKMQGAQAAWIAVGWAGGLLEAGALEMEAKG